MGWYAEWLPGEAAREWKLEWARSVEAECGTHERAHGWAPYCRWCECWGEGHRMWTWHEKGMTQTEGAAWRMRNDR